MLVKVNANNYLFRTLNWDFVFIGTNSLLSILNNI